MNTFREWRKNLLDRREFGFCKARKNQAPAPSRNTKEFVGNGQQHGCVDVGDKDVRATIRQTLSGADNELRRQCIQRVILTRDIERRFIRVEPDSRYSA